MSSRAPPVWQRRYLLMPSDPSSGTLAKLIEAMNTLLLRTLLSVHHHGSMAEAGRQLNLTHGGVAHQLRALEAEIGAALVERHGRSVYLTAAGLRLLQKAQQILDDVRSLPAVANADEIRGQLRLGVGNTMIVSAIPDLLACVVREYPQLRVNVHLGTSANFYAQVRAGELDAAIALEPPFGLQKEFGWKPFSETPLVLLVPSRLGEKAAIDLLRSQPFIHYDRSTWIGRQTDTYLRSLGLEPASQFEVPSTETIARMVHRGLGIAVVPRMRNLLSQDLNVTTLPLPGLADFRRFGFVWLHSSPRLSLINALSNLIPAQGRQASGAANDAA